MKKSLLMMFCTMSLVLGTVAVEAKGWGPHKRGEKPNIEEMHDNFAEKLNLSEEQKAKAKVIHEEGREKVKPLMDEMKVLREKMDNLREENMKQFEEILTPEQKAEFKKIKSERKEKMKKRFDEREKHKGKHGDKKGPKPEKAEPKPEPKPE